MLVRVLLKVCRRRGGGVPSITVLLCVWLVGVWRDLFASYEKGNFTDADIVCHVRENEEKFHWSKCTACTEEDKKAGAKSPSFLHSLTQYD